MNTTTTDTAADLDTQIKLNCDRCSGSGYWTFIVANSICFACGGSGHGGTTTQREINDKTARAEKRHAAKARKAARTAAKAEAMLADDAELATALKVDHDIISDISRRLHLTAKISDKQRALVVKIAAETTERATADAKRKAKLTDLNAGRYEITGEILAVKSYENHYGTTNKILVQLDNGNRVFGTVPISLCFNDDGRPITLRGRRVTFTAKVEPKERGFGFFSRPTKASHTL